MKFELEARDDVIKNSKTLEKSKGVVVKDTLFNLGYDSISYNSGKNVVLLKANQFIPTKVEKNIIRKKVYGGGLSRTLRRRYDVGGAVEAVLSIFAKIPLTKKFLDIQHSRMGIEETNKETFAENMVRFADEIADVETKNNPKKISSADAKGLHQFKDETVKTVVNNFISGRMPVDEDIINAVRAASKKDPRDWNRDESNLMVLGHMFLTSEKKTYNDKTMSTDPLLRIIGTAKEQDDSYKQAAEFLYMKFHWRGSETSSEYDQALKNIQNRYNKMSFIYGLNNRERSFAAVTGRPENIRPIGVRPMSEDKGFFNRLSNFYQANVSDAAEEVAQDQKKYYDYDISELLKPEPTKPRPSGLPYPRQAEADAYQARESLKLRDIWMPLEDGSLKYGDNYPSITEEPTINYPSMSDTLPAVPDPALFNETLPVPKPVPDWKGGMRKHSRTSEYREPYVVGGLVSKLANRISKAKTKRTYLTGLIKEEPDVLKKLKEQYKLDDDSYINALETLVFYKDQQVSDTLSLLAPFIPSKLKSKLHLHSPQQIFANTKKDYSILEEIYEQGTKALSSSDDALELKLLNLIDNYILDSSNRKQFSLLVRKKEIPDYNHVSLADPDIPLVEQAFMKQSGVTTSDSLEEIVPFEASNPELFPPKGVQSIRPTMKYNKDKGLFEDEEL